MRLILIFIIVPLMEILLLIEIGSRIGTLNTISIIIVTGILGGYMMRQQGFAILTNIRMDLSHGLRGPEKRFRFDLYLDAIL